MLIFLELMPREQVLLELLSLEQMLLEEKSRRSKNDKEVSVTAIATYQ